MPFLVFSLGFEYSIIFFIATFPSLLVFSTTFYKSKRKFDLFSPLNFILISLMIGTTLRTFYLLSTDSTGFRQARLLLDESPSFLILPAIYISVAFLFLILGFQMKIKPLNLARVIPGFKRPNWSTKTLFPLVFILIAISVIGSVVYFQKTGMQELSLETFSAKRRIFMDDARTQRVSYSYYKWIASLIQFPYYILLIQFAFSKRSFFSILGFLLLITGVLAFLFPVMTNSRSHVIYLIINTVMVWYYLRGFSIVLFSFAIPISFMFIFGLLILRQNRTMVDKPSNLSVGQIFEASVGYGNMLGIVKTGHIIKAVPEKVDYYYGKSMISWIFAPIPRTLWPGKPYMNPGAIVKQKFLKVGESKIMGGGVPPASIGELFWNFGYFGITIGMFLYGRMIKLFYVSFKPWLPVSKSAMLLYVCLIMQFSFVLVGNSFNQFILQSIQNGLPAVICILILRKTHWKS